MSAVYFDGTHVLYDNIVVYDDQEAECNKVIQVRVKDTDRTLTVCCIGHWALGRLCTDFVEENARRFLKNKQTVCGDGELRAIAEKNKAPFECFVIDSHDPTVWMLDTSIAVWGRIPRQAFIIGHHRAVAVTALIAPQGIDAVKEAWITLENSPFFNDRVTRQPYTVAKVVATD